MSAATQTGMPMNAYEGRSHMGEDAGGQLFADIGRLGSPEAKKSVVLSSGRGGLSGYLLSGILVNCLESRIYLQLPRDMSLVFVHAINPHGPCWGPFIPDKGNLELEDGEGLPSWNRPLLDAADQRFLDLQGSGSFDRAHLENMPLSAIVQPAWEGAALHHAMRRFLPETAEMIVMDFRVGAGDYGQVELLAETGGVSAIDNMAHDVFPEAQTVGQYPHNGQWALTGAGIPGFDLQAQILPLIMEFGLYRQPSLMDVISDDFLGDPQATKSDLAQMDEVWCKNAWRHAETMILRAMDGLA